MGNSSTVTLTFDANTQAAVRAWQKFEQAADSLNAKINKLGQTGESAGGKLEGMFSASTQQLVKFAAGMAGVGSATAAIAAIARQLRVEYDRMMERQKAAADKQIDVATAQRSAIGNLGEDPTLTASQMTKRIEAISLKTGVSQRDLYAAASNALSARGQMSGAETMEAVQAAAEFAPDNPEGISTVAGSILDLQKKNGGSAREQMGFIKQAQQSARVESVQAFARNIAPIVSQLQDFGNTQEESAELVSAMSQSMNDVQGEMTGSAAINLAKHLEEALPSKQYPQLKSTMDRIKYLQSEEGKSKRNKLLYGTGKTHKGKIETEAKAYTTVHALLTPEDNATKQMLRAAQESIGAPGVQTEAALDKYLADVDEQSVQKVAAANRQAQVSVEATQIGDTESPYAIARKGLNEQLAASGVGSMDAFWSARQFDYRANAGGENPYQAAAGIARERAGDIREFGEEQGYGPNSKRNMESLERFARTMDEASKRMEQALEKNTKATEENTGDSPPFSDRPKSKPPSKNLNRGG